MLEKSTKMFSANDVTDVAVDAVHNKTLPGSKRHSRRHVDILMILSIFYEGKSALVHVK